MSNEHEAGHELVQEVDSVQSATIITIGALALGLFALGVAWAVHIQRETTAIIFEQTGSDAGTAGTVRSFTPDQVPVGRRDEVGMVYQSSFDSDFAAKRKAAQDEYLDSVGWVDEKAKRVHIPIERAMKDYLAEVEKDGSKL
jgi:hypothetical protein